MYLKPIKIGDLEIKNNIFLAPMAGITDKTYRKIIYYLPVYALILPLPIGLLSGYFLEMIHII